MIRILPALLWIVCSASVIANPPELLLAASYTDSVEVHHYWVSEKLDGVRAYWDGRQLLSRSGHVLMAPVWFTRDFPSTPLDGELWSGRGQLEQIVSTVRKQQPVDNEWRALAFHVFELPDGEGTFSERLQTLQRIVQQQHSAYLKLVPQFRIDSREQLFERLDDIVRQGGEGLMLHHQAALYSTGRNNDLLKLKKQQDAEAIVIGYTAGKGKYQGITGALQVKTVDGRQFAIGSGLSDAMRRSPPAIGTRITYQHNGLTAKGLPRFARFLRIREDI